MYFINMLEKQFFKKINKIESSEKRERYNRYVLEVGCGSTPAPFIKPENLKEYQDAYIVRIDLGGPGSTEALEKQRIIRSSEIQGSVGGAQILDKEILSKIPEWKGKIDYLQTDAASLPFKENSFDEIYMTNVIGYPNKNVDEIKKMFKESSRVLKKNGELVIVETYTPQCAVDAGDDTSGKSFQKKIKLLGEKMKDFGFRVKKIEFPSFNQDIADYYYRQEEKQPPEILEKYKKQYNYGYKITGMAFFRGQPEDRNFALILEK